MNKKCYLAGPMRGRHLYNFPSFFEAAGVLAWHGWEVYNPAEIDMLKGFRPDEPLDSENNASVFSLKSAFVCDFEAIMDGDAVFFLPGWQNSTGAKAEYIVAKLTGKDCYELTKYNMHLKSAPWLDYKKLGDNLLEMKL